MQRIFIAADLADQGIGPDDIPSSHCLDCDAEAGGHSYCLQCDPPLEYDPADRQYGPDDPTF